MIVNVVLKTDGLHHAHETGETPDFKNIFSGIAGITFVQTFGRGRLARFEMTDDAYEHIKKNFADQFAFTKDRELKPGIPPEMESLVSLGPNPR